MDKCKIAIADKTHFRNRANLKDKALKKKYTKQNSISKLNARPKFEIDYNVWEKKDLWSHRRPN